jgi:hypothetical protein
LVDADEKDVELYLLDFKELGLTYVCDSLEEALYIGELQCLKNDYLFYTIEEF